METVRDTTRSGSNGRLHLHGARNVLCLKSVQRRPPRCTSISESPLNFPGKEFQRAKRSRETIDGRTVRGVPDANRRDPAQPALVRRVDYRSELNVIKSNVRYRSVNATVGRCAFFQRRGRRVPSNDARTADEKVPMRSDTLELAEKARDEPRHRNEESMDVLLFAVRQPARGTGINRSSD